MIEALGTVSAKDDVLQMKRGETQLAVAILLYSVIPADRVYAPEERLALRQGLIHIFGCSEEKCHRLISRASSKYQLEPTLLAPATLLKHRVSKSFRNLVLATARRIAMSDGHIHEFEADVLRRMTQLLGLNDAAETLGLTG
jgi:uncharacterized tellurite resistance protein B-like protein